MKVLGFIWYYVITNKGWERVQFWKFWNDRLNCFVKTLLNTHLKIWNPSMIGRFVTVEIFLMDPNTRVFWFCVFVKSIVLLLSYFLERTILRYNADFLPNLFHLQPPQMPFIFQFCLRLIKKSFLKRSLKNLKNPQEIF